MAKINPLNFPKIKSEYFAAEAAIDPILVSAKITSLKFDGKDVPAAEAALSVKIGAIGALLATGDKTQDTSELIAANGQLAAQVDTLEAGHVNDTATISAQVQKITGLEGQLSTANASTQKLTADLGTANNLLTASNAEVSRLTGAMASQKKTLAERCVAANCLDFPKDATAEHKLAFAMNLSHEDLFKAYNGAVNLAISKTGVSFDAIPAQQPSGAGTEKPVLKGRERFKAGLGIVMGGAPFSAR